MTWMHEIPPSRHLLTRCLLFPPGRSCLSFVADCSASSRYSERLPCQRGVGTLGLVRGRATSGMPGGCGCSGRALARAATDAIRVPLYRTMCNDTHVLLLPVFPLLDTLKAICTVRKYTR